VGLRTQKKHSSPQGSLLGLVRAVSTRLLAQSWPMFGDPNSEAGR
jgi:hypothetical protein